jgi:hypothetical protein
VTIRERLERDPEAVLSRTDVAALGWPRRAVDTIFRHCPVVRLSGFTRPYIFVKDYLAFVDSCTSRAGGGDRVTVGGHHRA